MATQPAGLSVSLGDVPVGQLSLDRHGAVDFRWLSSYLQIFPRPVLGQQFLDDADAVLHSRTRLPAWFSSLLPGGALRKLIAKKSVLLPAHEYALLHVLGHDLPGQRVHIEDFAQVLGVYPEQKYKGANYETLASIVLALAGQGGLGDYLRRLVFVVASGNGDAHLKNWSLIYPDGVVARLSPVYDQVSTIQYIPGDKLALNLGRSKKWADVTMAAFQRLARKLGVDERGVSDTVAESVQVIRQAWLAHGKSLYTAAQQRVIEEHWRGVPLLS